MRRRAQVAGLAARPWNDWPVTIGRMASCRRSPRRAHQGPHRTRPRTDREEDVRRPRLLDPRAHGHQRQRTGRRARARRRRSGRMELVAATAATVAVMRGREMPGWLRVAAGDILTTMTCPPGWRQASAYARSLPPKQPAGQSREVGDPSRPSGRRRSPRMIRASAEPATAGTGGRPASRRNVLIAGRLVADGHLRPRRAGGLSVAAPLGHRPLQSDVRICRNEGVVYTYAYALTGMFILSATDRSLPRLAAGSVIHPGKPDHRWHAD